MQKNMIYKWGMYTVTTVVMLVVMAYQLTENSTHEVLGLLLLLLFIIHQFLNRQWYQHLFQGRYTTRRIIGITVNLFMLLAILTIITTALPISRTVFAFLKIQNGMLVAQIHIFAAYWLFILLSIHLGLHGDTIINKLERSAGTKTLEKNFLLRIALRMLILVIAIYGMYSSGNRNIGSKLIMYSTFDTWRLNDSLLGFLTDYLSIMLLYFSGAYYLSKSAFKTNPLIKIKK